MMSTITKISANSAAGFEYSYYLSIPDTVRDGASLLVEPNNTGTGDDDLSVHESAAATLIQTRADNTFQTLNLPILVPTFPRPFTNGDVYTHALDRDALTTSISGLQRFDQQLLAMIADAQTRLAQSGIAVDSKVLMNGFSASGQFVNRFTLLHPESVKAAAFGGTGWTTLPTTTFGGESLDFGVGVGDLQTVIGQAFDEDAYRNVPQFTYVGDQDNNDPVPFNDGFSDSERSQIYRFFRAEGSLPVDGFPAQEALFNQIAASADFKIFSGVGHESVPAVGDVISFFESILAGSQSQILGSSGADQLSGTALKSKPDLILAGAGNDIVAAGLGNDIVFGEDGADALSGEDGADTLYGGADIDTIFGGSHADVIYGNKEIDVLSGGAGNDVLFGVGCISVF